MADVFTRKKRSEVMSRIRSKGTKAEEAVFSMVRRALGGRRLIERNVRGLAGNPDLVIPSLRLAIFVDGCFYHGCSAHGHIPKSNRRYWAAKLAGNRRRDRLNRQRLRRFGYSVWSFWEHSLEGRRLLRTRVALERRLESLCAKRSSSGAKSAKVSQRGRI